MNNPDQLERRVESLEQKLGHRSVQTTTYWAKTTEDVDGATDPKVGVETEVEPLINDRSETDSHKVGQFTGGTQTAIHRGPDGIAANTTVLVEVTSLGHAIVPGNTYPVVLRDDLGAAADKFSAPADLPDAWANLVKKNEDGTWEVDETVPAIQLRSRSNLSFGAGTLGEWKWFMGIRQFIPIECSDGGSSSSSTAGRVL